MKSYNFSLDSYDNILEKWGKYIHSNSIKSIEFVNDIKALDFKVDNYYKYEIRKIRNLFYIWKRWSF